MKKIYFSLFILSALFSKAQLTESNHAPNAGHKYETYQCDSLNISPGASGAGAVWNFAPNTHSSVVLSYTSSVVNGNPSYPDAKVAVVASPTITSFYKSDNNGLWYYGGHVPVPPPVVATLNYTSPAVQATYPMSLNTTSSAVTGGSMTATAPVPASGTFTGTSSFTVDGTGTLTVAGVTYTNAIKIVTEQVIDFVASVSGTVTQIKYEYFAVGIKPAIFTISESTITATFIGTQTQTLVSRLKSSTNTSLSEINSESLLNVYPNPAINEVRFTSTEKNLTVNIYDITGKLVASELMTSGVLKLNVSGYIKGMYIYRVSSQEGKTLSTGKLTVIQ